YLLNAGPSFGYARHRRELSEASARTVAALNRDGVAITSIDAIGIAPALFAELTDAVDRIESAKDDELADIRRRANDASAIGSKTFNVELLGPKPVLDTQNVFCRLAVAPSMLEIANAYFGMLTRLRYYNVWHTFATAAQPRESQLWHRDREDFLIMKVFVY